MFSKERNNLRETIPVFSFSDFEKLIQRQKKLEATQQNVAATVRSLLSEGAQIHTALSDAKNRVAISNVTAVSSCFQTIQTWKTAYEQLLQVKKKTPQAFESASLIADCKKLSSYSDTFSIYYAKKNDFEAAVAFYKELKQFNGLTESNVKKIYPFATRYHKLTSAVSQYIPADTVTMLKNAEQMYFTVTGVERFYDKLDSFLRSYYSSITERSMNYNAEILRNAAQQAQAYPDEFKRLDGDRSLSVFARFNSYYKSKLQAIVSGANSWISETVASENARRQAYNKMKASTLTVSIINWSLVGIVALFTIISTCVSFAASMGVIGVVLGIIVGALFSAVRVATLCGLGSIWWPSMFSTLFFGPESSSVSPLIVIFNIVMVFFWYLNIIMNYRLGNKAPRYFDEEPYAVMAVCVPWIGFGMFVIRLIWGGMFGLAKLWSGVWVVISGFCGIFFGLFRCLMLAFGAGFWWPGLYSVTNEAGILLNIFFYLVLGGGIAVTIIYKDDLPY